MLQSHVISEASFTFVLPEGLWFVSIERYFKGCMYISSELFPFATMMSAVARR